WKSGLFGQGDCMSISDDEIPADADQLRSVAEQTRSDTAPIRGRYRKRTKVKLIGRNHLDGRTHAARKFDSTVAGIASDLGGADQLSTVQRNLIEAFAGASALLNHMNAQLLSGQTVNMVEYAQAGSLMVRIAARLGIYPSAARGRRAASD